MDLLREADAQVLLLRFDRALPLLRELGDEAALQRLLHLAMDFGRFPVVRAFREQGALPEAQWRDFLWHRALPRVPIGGDESSGFSVDEPMVAEIAQELDQSVPAALARVTRWMLERGSRQVAKHFVFAKLSGDPALVALVQPAFEAAAAMPRRQLPQLLEDAVAVRGGRLGPVLQQGDTDNYNPLSATVWRAHLADEAVVIKENLRLPIGYARFDGYSDEAGMLGRLRHDQVVDLRDQWSLLRHEALVLAVAPGVSLQGAGPLDVGTAAEIGAQLAQVLGFFHRQGVVYADVKGHNVLWDGQRATLVDFGMAQALRGADTVASLPSTPSFVPPEVTRTLHIGPPGDVFQLGIVLFQLLTGHHPFGPDLDDEAPREQLIREVAVANLHDPPALQDIPHPTLRDLLRRMLRRRPAERPTASEVASILREIA